MASNDPTQDSGTVAAAAIELRQYADRWELGRPGPGIWTATRRSADRRHIRVIVSNDPGELAGKLEAAETCEPS
jgi:hypothetical protein